LCPRSPQLGTLAHELLAKQARERIAILGLTRLYETRRVTPTMRRSASGNDRCRQERRDPRTAPPRRRRRLKRGRPVAESQSAPAQLPGELVHGEGTGRRSEGQEAEAPRRQSRLRVQGGRGAG